LIPLNEEERLRLSDSFNNVSSKTLLVDFSSRVYIIRDLMDLKDDDDSFELLLCGMMCFYGCVLLSISQFGEIRNVNDLFKFTALYLYVDHYLDNISVSIEEKKKVLSKMKSVLINPKRLSDEDCLEISEYERRRLIFATDMLVDLIEKYDILNDLKNVFYFQVKGLQIQGRKDYSEEEYIEILEKSSYSVFAIQSILGGSKTEKEYQIGRCVQLIDDFVDVYKDMDEGINTYATYCLKRDGILDNYINYMNTQIDKLYCSYNAVKPFMYGIIAYCVTKHKDISVELKQDLQRYSIIDHSTGVQARQLFIRWLKEEIEEHEKETGEQWLKRT